MSKPPDGPVDVKLTQVFNEAAMGPDKPPAPPKPPTLEYRPPLEPSLGGPVYRDVAKEVAGRSPVNDGPSDRGPKTLRERFNEASREGREQKAEVEQGSKGLRERFNAAAKAESLKARFNRESSLRERFNQATRDDHGMSRD